MIQVVNKHHHQSTPHDIYIGRGSALGNPYTGSKQLKHTKALYQCATREEAIRNYRDWIAPRIDSTSVMADTEAIRLINTIKDKASSGDVFLVCYCAPSACHGEVIKEIIESMLNLTSPV